MSATCFNLKYFFQPNKSLVRMSGGFRLGCQYSLMIVFLMLAGCSTINLISEDRRQEWTVPNSGKSIQQLQQEVLQQIDPSNRYLHDGVMKITAFDTWNSTLIRWMTPLDQDQQKFQARLALYHQGIEFTFLNGEKKGQTIGFDGQSYEYDATQKRYIDSKGMSLYLGPLQNYLEWSQTLMRKQNLKILGMREIKSIPYYVLYVTEGSLEALDQYDQYLIYINSKNSRIDYIEFTMRELMKSYKGVVHYKQYKMVQGILMPCWIGISDDLLKPNFDHNFTIESMEFNIPD